MPTLVFKLSESQSLDFPLSGDLVKLGRNPANDIVIDNSWISSFHAEFDLEPGRAMVRDLNSSNGTSINGERIDTAPLKNGDTISFGQLDAVYVDARSAAEAPAPAKPPSRAPRVMRPQPVLSPVPLPATQKTPPPSRREGYSQPSPVATTPVPVEDMALKAPPNIVSRSIPAESPSKQEMDAARTQLTELRKAVASLMNEKAVAERELEKAAAARKESAALEASLVSLRQNQAELQKEFDRQKSMAERELLALNDQLLARQAEAENASRVAREGAAANAAALTTEQQRELESITGKIAEARRALVSLEEERGVRLHSTEQTLHKLLQDQSAAEAALAGLTAKLETAGAELQSIEARKTDGETQLATKARATEAELLSRTQAAQADLQKLQQDQAAARSALAEVKAQLDAATSGLTTLQGQQSAQEKERGAQALAAEQALQKLLAGKSAAEQALASVQAQVEAAGKSLAATQEQHASVSEAHAAAAASLAAAEAGLGSIQQKHEVSMSALGLLDAEHSSRMESAAAALGKIQHEIAAAEHSLAARRAEEQAARSAAADAEALLHTQQHLLNEAKEATLKLQAGVAQLEASKADLEVRLKAGEASLAAQIKADNDALAENLNAGRALLQTQQDELAAVTARTSELTAATAGLGEMHAAISAAKIELALQQNFLTESAKSKAALAAELDSLRAEREALTDVTNKLKAAEEAKDAANRELEDMLGKITAAAAELRGAQEAAARQEKEAAAAQEKSAAVAREMEAQVASVRSDLHAAENEAQSALRSVQEEMDRLKTEHRDLESKRASAAAELEALSASLVELKGHHETTHSLVQSLKQTLTGHEESIGTSDARALQAAAAAAAEQERLTALRKEADEFEAGLDARRKAAAATAEETAEATRQLEAVRAEIALAESEHATARQAKNALLSDLHTMERRAKELSSKESEWQDFKNQFATADAAIAGREENLAGLQKQIAEAGKALEAMKAASAEAMKAAENLAAIKAETAQHSSRRDAAVRAAETAQADLAALETRLAAARGDAAGLHVLSAQAAELTKSIKALEERRNTLSEAPDPNWGTVHLLAKSIIKQVDLLDDLIAHLVAHKAPTEAIEQMSLLRAGLTDLLADNSVVPYTFEPGTALDLASRKRIQIVESRDVPGTHTRIDRVFRPGYVCTNGTLGVQTLLRKAEVAVLVAS